MGVEAGKIVICHVDVELHTAYLRALLERGLFVEFDDFGKEFDTEAGDRSFAGGPFARDTERVRAVKEILDWGYGDQLLLTTDICLKSLLHAFGGNGYDHILGRVVPMMREEGIPQEAIDALLIANPKRLFDS
jgi:phosphotriesterase-related protein